MSGEQTNPTDHHRLNHELDDDSPMKVKPSGRKNKRLIESDDEDEQKSSEKSTIEAGEVAINANG